MCAPCVEAIVERAVTDQRAQSAVRGLGRPEAPPAARSPLDNGTGIAGHQCGVNRLAGRPRAHGTKARTEVTCPECGKVWRVTKRHYPSPDGRRGAVCGCGWALVRTIPVEREEAA